MTNQGRNADPAEVARFNALASRWWDPAGEMRLLHAMNPLRLAYVAERLNLTGVRILDVGCGAGLLAEAMARRGASVTGIDLAEDSLVVARLHQQESSVSGLTYRRITAEELAEREPGAYDGVTCMEMLEHVPDPQLTVAACARLARPGGHLFVSTINRTAKAYALTVLGAEYVARLLPRGTHDYARFIRPSELDRWARTFQLQLRDVTGLDYDPVRSRFSLSGDVAVNYLAHFRRQEQ